MVKESLNKILKKYPYFLTKDPNSIHYKTTLVNNKHIQRLYNTLYKVYQSFRLNKRILIWKTQTEDYNHTIHFQANYPNIKNVKIYKNDILIKQANYNKLDVNTFEFDYHVEYVKNNIKKLNTYICTECGTIYFDDTLPLTCTYNNCESHTYYPCNIYECSECGEVYFIVEDTNTISDYNCTKNNHINTLKQIYAYRCRNCGEIYLGEEPPNECTNCFIEDYTNKGQYLVKGTLKTETSNPNDNFTVDIITNNSIVDTVELNLTNNHETYTKPLSIRDGEGNPIVYTLSYTSSEFNVELENYAKHYNTNTGQLIAPIYINDDSIQLIDNSETIYTYDTIVDTVTYDDVHNTLIEDDGDVDSGEPFLIEIPIIPTDSYRLCVTTWDEYEIEKGFPENDYTLIEYNRGRKNNTITPNVFDHDYSLDKIGSLHNIPRKEYKFISDPLLYRSTEPPYSIATTEDDYHYMKRILEYMERMWWMNPVSLELWKMYGIESTLVNRERYLLKVFDEQEHSYDETTGLVGCWSPRAWEHKDKFCDGSRTLGEYFFVTTSNIRPIIGESITCNFKILNSLAQPIEEDNEYSIDVYKIITQSDKDKDILRNDKLYTQYNLNDKYPLYTDVTNMSVVIPSLYLSDVNNVESNNLATNIFYFTCKRKNGTFIGDEGIYLVVNVRDYDDADIFVDPLNPNSKGDGSITNPFHTLEEALEEVTLSSDLIGLANNINLNNPLIINKSCIILGKSNISGNAPVINQLHEITVNNKTVYNNRFFKITGNKNCRLLLANLQLQSGERKSEININTWLNNNKHTANFTTVMIHGGAVILSLTPSYTGTYYPYDYITGVGKITKTDGTPLVNQTVNLYYNNVKKSSYNTDNNGMFNYTFHLEETVQGDYTISLQNESELFFETQISEIIHATTPYTLHDNEDDTPLYLYRGDTVDLPSSNHEPNEDVKYYSSKEGLITSLSTGENTVTVLTHNVVNGQYFIYTTMDNNMDGKVRDEWLIESKVDFTILSEYLSSKYNGSRTLVKNFRFDNSNHELTYDLVEVNNDTVMGDLEGVVLNVTVSNTGELQITSFDTNYDKQEDNYILYSDMVKLKDAFHILTFNEETGVLSGERIGEFWTN